MHDKEEQREKTSKNPTKTKKSMHVPIQAKQQPNKWRYDKIVAPCNIFVSGGSSTV